MGASPADVERSGCVLRFCVAASDGRRSLSWRVWTGHRKPTDEIYVAPRHMAGDLKFSAHSSGYSQFGPTRRLRDKSSPDDRAAFSNRESGAGGAGVVLALQFHRSELRPRDPDTEEVTIEMRDGEDALALLVIVAPQSSDLPAGCRVAGVVARRSPDPVLLVAVPTPPMLQLLEDARRVLEAPYETWRMRVDWGNETHAVVVAGDGRGGPQMFLEMAVDEPPARRTPTALDGIVGEVLTFGDLPAPARGDVDSCAAVEVSDDGRTRLYVNEYSRCDHGHLASDVSRLLAAFNRSGPGPGWTRLVGPSPGWIATIVTRKAFERRTGRS